ncbi:hypothetical protein ACFWAN_17800 [Streptomyces mirabilis]|uniref:hypothetical protein n=1 Tax=Streptomyces mirabilis TaxID=68239 RepID=UPI00365048BE
MHEDELERNAALVELRKRLEDGLASARLSKTQLASQARLSRTTVHGAFKADATTAPTAETVIALARVLRLPEEDLLDLRRAAAEEVGSVERKDEGPGKPIGDWDPHELEVHPAGPALSKHQPAGLSILPGYVMRDHDRVLDEVVSDAAGGHSRMVVLVGTSSTGKTRACWEAVQPLASSGWRLWHPFDPTRGEAALEGLQQVRPCTVVWLNEAQHYLGNPRTGERVAAAIHGLLTDTTRGPILVLGTLWPEYADEFAALVPPGKPDRYSRVRELLAGRTLTVPESFNQQALREAASLAKDGDLLLADALTRATASGRVAQDLAGAPELLRRYEQSTLAARALLEAAMDARRFGVGLHLPQAFLIDAAADYLSDDDFDQLAENWAESAFADLARPVHGKQAALRCTSPRSARRPPNSLTTVTSRAVSAGPMFRLADYLEQHGRKSRRVVCPPDSFWHAAYTHLTESEDLNNLAEAAEDRHRLQWAYHLRSRAADAGDASAKVHMGRMRASLGHDKEAIGHFEEAAEAGSSAALCELALMFYRRGGMQPAQALLGLAVDAGNRRALHHLTLILVEADDWEGAEAVACRAAEAGDPLGLSVLAEERDKVGDPTGAESLYRRAADAGDSRALLELVRLRRKAGDREGAVALEEQAVSAGGLSKLQDLAMLRDMAGDTAGAEALARRAVDAGAYQAANLLALKRMGDCDWEEAEALLLPAAKVGDADALTFLAQLRDRSGDRTGAEELARKAADAGETFALCFLAMEREEEGDLEGAESLYRQAVEVGDVSALDRLAQRRMEAGDREGADAYYRQAADAGKAQPLILGTRWPYGLDADGTPTAPWR